MYRTKIILVLTIVLANLLVFVKSGCPNLCSGHGSCGPDNVCSCFEGWRGGAPDCSYRECPTGAAWFDKPYGDDLAHLEVECSNAGICDYLSGTCTCFEGYTGNACQRNKCPKDCNGRGTCTSMRELSLFSGPDYSHNEANGGDGMGPEYSNWDRFMTHMCECDPGYFGPDCSQIMCPKADDPLTLNQNHRRIRLSVTGDGDYGLNNEIGLEYNGHAVPLSVDAAQTTTECTRTLSFAGPFGDVKCEYEEINPLQRDFYLTFLSWPLYPRENNIFQNNGNPAITEFYCDVSAAPFGTKCTFTDETTDYIREYSYCSRRGKCDFSEGLCYCDSGYAGLACNESTPILQPGTNAMPGLLVNAHGSDFTSAVLSMRTEKAGAPDFNFTQTETSAGTSFPSTSFSVRGDGAMKADHLIVLTGGQTIAGGGLFVVDGGVTIEDDGLHVSSGMWTEKTADIASLYTGDPDLTSDFTVLELSSLSRQSSHALFRASRRDVEMFYMKADGGTYISHEGLRVTGGMSILSNGISSKYDNVNVDQGKLFVVDDVIAHGGLQVIDGGIQVYRRGAKIYDGGLEVGNEKNTIGGTVIGGVSVQDGGLTVTGGMTLTTKSLTVTGGVTVNDGGLFINPITAVGMTIEDGGVTITGGLTISDGATLTGGLTIVDIGLFVEAGGLTVDSGALVVTDGLTVITSGMKVQAPAGDFNTFRVFADGVRITGGLSIDAGGFFSEGGMSLEGSAVVAGGGTVMNEGIHVTNGLTILDGGGTAINLIFGRVDFHDDVVFSGGVQAFDGGINADNLNLVTLTNGLSVFTQHVDGKCFIDDSTSYTVSDRRLKTNYAPIDGALGKVSRLNGVYYDWLQNSPPGILFDRERHVGVIAQEVWEVLPEVVDTKKHGEYLAVDYYSIVPLLIEAIKDLINVHAATLVQTVEPVHKSIYSHRSASKWTADVAKLNEMLKVEESENELLQKEIETIRQFLNLM